MKSLALSNVEIPNISLDDYLISLAEEGVPELNVLF